MLSYLWTSPVQTKLTSSRAICQSAAQPVASCSYSSPVNRAAGWHCHPAPSKNAAASRQFSAVANAKSRSKADSEPVSESLSDFDQNLTSEGVSDSLGVAAKKTRTRKVKVSEPESAESVTNFSAAPAPARHLSKEAPQETSGAAAKKTRKPRTTKATAAAALDMQEEEAAAAPLPPAELETEMHRPQQAQETSSSSTAEYDEQEQEQELDMEGEMEEGEEEEAGDYALAAYSSAEDGGEGDEEEYEEGEYDAEVTAEDDDDSNVDIYEQFYGGKAYFPRHLLPKNEEERQQMLFQLKREAFLVRQNNSWEVEDLAWESHHHQTRVGVNKYANVRRIAGMMSFFENDDYQLGPNQPGNLSSWARSEIVFRGEFDEFNTYVNDNMESIVKQATEEEKQEDADFLEDVMMMPILEDNRVERKFLTDKEQEEVMTSMFLEGILPNVSLSSTSQQFADDIFVADDSMLLDDDILERQDVGKKPAKASSKPKEEQNQGSENVTEQDDEQDFAEGGTEQGAGGDDEQDMSQGAEDEGEQPMGEMSDTEDQN